MSIILINIAQEKILEATDVINYMHKILSVDSPETTDDVVEFLFQKIRDERSVDSVCRYADAIITHQPRSKKDIVEFLFQKVPNEHSIYSVLRYVDAIIKYEPAAKKDVVELLFQKARHGFSEHSVLPYVDAIIRYEPGAKHDVVNFLFRKIRDESSIDSVLTYADVIMRHDPAARYDVVKVLLEKIKTAPSVKMPILTSRVLSLLSSYTPEEIPEDILREAQRIIPKLNITLDKRNAKIFGTPMSEAQHNKQKHRPYNPVGVVGVVI